MNHFDISDWTDFARGCAAVPDRAQMQAHLDGGCRSCRATVESAPASRRRGAGRWSFRAPTRHRALRQGDQRPPAAPRQRQGGMERGPADLRQPARTPASRHTCRDAGLAACRVRSRQPLHRSAARARTGANAVGRPVDASRGSDPIPHGFAGTFTRPPRRGRPRRIESVRRVPNELPAGARPSPVYRPPRPSGVARGSVAEPDCRRSTGAKTGSWIAPEVRVKRLREITRSVPRFGYAAIT